MSVNVGGAAFPICDGWAGFSGVVLGGVICYGAHGMGFGPWPVVFASVCVCVCVCTRVKTPCSLRKK